MNSGPRWTAHPTAFSHGDVLGQFAAAGTAMTGSQAFDPWGNVTAATGSLIGELGFQSAWTDPGAGKDLMGARWYSPSAGDFTSADTVQVPPVPDPAAASPFAYAADDPLDAIDPTGHVVINICGNAASLAAVCGIALLGGKVSSSNKNGMGNLQSVGQVFADSGGARVPAQTPSEIAYELFLRVRAEDQAAKLRSARAQPQKPADASRPASTPVIRTAQSCSRPQGTKHSSGGGSSRPAAAAAKPPGHASGPAPPGPASPVVSPEQDEAQILAQVEAAIGEMAAGKSLTSAAPDLGTGTETIPIGDQGPSVVSTPEAPDLGTGTETIPIADQGPGLTDKVTSEQPTGGEQLPLFDEDPYRVAAKDGRTRGVLQLDGEEIPLVSQEPLLQNYAASAHVEGQAALIMRERGATSGTLQIDNPNGICGRCTAQVNTRDLELRACSETGLFSR
jgi:RHS repeat-associated protein